MSCPSRTVSPSAEELEALLRLVARRAEVLFRRHGVDARRAEDILHDCLVVLAFRWSRVANRQRWLLEMIENRCREPASVELQAEG